MRMVLKIMRGKNTNICYINTQGSLGIFLFLSQFNCYIKFCIYVVSAIKSERSTFEAAGKSK